MVPLPARTDRPRERNHINQHQLDHQQLAAPPPQPRTPDIAGEHMAVDADPVADAPLGHDAVDQAADAAEALQQPLQPATPRLAPSGHAFAAGGPDAAPARQGPGRGPQQAAVAQQQSGGADVAGDSNRQPDCTDFGELAARLVADAIGQVTLHLSVSQDSP